MNRRNWLLAGLALALIGITALKGVGGGEGTRAFAQAYGTVTSVAVGEQPTATGVSAVAGSTVAASPAPPATGSGTDGDNARLVQIAVLTIAAGIVVLGVSTRLRRR